MADLRPRNIVVCCDGTSNEIGVLLSNVLKLYRLCEKSEEQLTFYQPGIGTIAMPDSWGRWRQKMRSIFEMATGRGLDRDVLNAYRFLCTHYRPGDRIFLFGFSRGAYTVRVLAGLVYLIGLLREHQANFAEYALKAYKSCSKANEQTAHDFTEVVLPQVVAIDFLGVWDTVASVIIPGRAPFSKLRLEELPYTTSNPAVQTFRQAIAIDEFRRMFRIERWDEGQEFKPNRFSTGATPKQDCRQVWFAGCHSDIGGGYPEVQSAISKIPLLWMIDQASAAGLKVRTQMVNHIARGLPRKNARTYQKPDPNGPLHNSMGWYWWLVEWFPKSARLKDWPKRKSFLGFYIPWAEPRFIAPDAIVSDAVYKRMRDPRYHPVNVPPPKNVEPMSVEKPAKPAGRKASGKAAAAPARSPPA